MAEKYMYCPVHKNNCIASNKMMANIYSKDEKVYAFCCEECKRYYFNSNGKMQGTKSTGRKEAIKGFEIYVTEQKVYDNKPSLKPQASSKPRIFTDSIFKSSTEASTGMQPPKGKQSTPVSAPKQVTVSNTREVRIHLFKKDEADSRLLASLANLMVEYPPIGTINNINELLKKVFPSGIDQDIVARNLSFIGTNGYVIRRIEIYNKKSSFLAKRLPENTYLVFAGKLSDGEFVIDEMRVIQNPVKKKDDYERTCIFMYDGPKHANMLWDLTNVAAEQPEELKGELADWSEYLDWKRQLAEMRIQGIKYIGIRFEIDDRQMRILTVTDGEEAFKKFRKALRRNEISAFSNVYSSDPWMFKFNHDENAYKNEAGIDLVFIGEGARYSRRDINGYWDQVRRFCKKYSEHKDETDIYFLLDGILKNYTDPQFIELVFELSNSALEVIERQIRKTGTVSGNILSLLAGEFYGDGFLATSQIGDFALLKRLKNAVMDLVRGKAASQGLDGWLFDISKARMPKHLERIITWQNPNINESQKRAVEKILSAPDVCLIQGPPGTGKTTVIAEAIYQSVIRNQRVLVASQANLAVDNALERLISNPKIRAIRLGSAKKIDSSVSNITEENVLQSFYESIIDYIDSSYLNTWRQTDSIVAACEEDYEKVIMLENQNTDLANEETLINISIKKLEEGDEDTRSNGRRNELKMERASLAMLKAFLSGAIDDLELTLKKEAIFEIWKVMRPHIIDAQNKGLWIVRVGISERLLDSEDGVDQANEIIKQTMLNMRLADGLLMRLNGEQEFGGSSAELEILKIKERKIKEKVLKEMNPDDMQEWRKINEEIAKLAATCGLRENEELLFGQNGDERAEITSSKKQLTAILISSEKILDQLKKDLLEKTEEISTYILGQINDIDTEKAGLDARKKELEYKKRELGIRVEKNQNVIKQILDKYETNRESFEKTLSEVKEMAELYSDTKVDREEWEEVFVKLKEWVSEIPDYTQEKDLFLRTFINGCNVVGVSCTENARTLNEAGFDAFDLVIIDEVSKATPPELLIPMLRGRKIVLVGDHRQLPPLFNEHEKTYLEVAQQQQEMTESSDNDGMIVELTMDDFEKYKEMVTASLFQSYFEQAKEDIKETLTYQYRMHKDIMDIVNIFYDGYLVDGNAGQYDDGRKNHNLYIHSTGGTAMIIPDRHAYWFDSSTLDGVPVYEHRKPGSTSAENIVEAYAIIELLKKMEIEYANQDSVAVPISVGVISFYYDQVSTLRAMIRQEVFHAIDIEINTVDRFQGKEKEIIIVSLVRNVKNARHKTDSHIAAFQRINVAFSRAQNLLIIVGAKDMYAPQPVLLTDMNTGEEKEVEVYKNIIEMMDAKGTLFSCDELIPETVTNSILEKMI